MNIEELMDLLNQKNFEEEEQDTGMEYTYKKNNIELICYIEPQVEVQFISFYRWDNNEVKGTYNISIDELKFTKDSVISFFKRTKNNLPVQIGDSINVHSEVDKAIEEIF